MFSFPFSCRVRAEIAVIIGADMNAYMMSRFSACVLPVYDIIVKSPLCLRAKIEEALYCNLNRSLWHTPIHSYFEDIIHGHCGMPQSGTLSTSCRSLVLPVNIVVLWPRISDIAAYVSYNVTYLPLWFHLISPLMVMLCPNCHCASRHKFPDIHDVLTLPTLDKNGWLPTRHVMCHCCSLVNFFMFNYPIIMIFHISLIFMYLTYIQYLNLIKQPVLFYFCL